MFNCCLSVQTAEIGTVENECLLHRLTVFIAAYFRMIFYHSLKKQFSLLGCETNECLHAFVSLSDKFYHSQFFM